MSASDRTGFPGYVVDASVWVSQFIEREANHSASAAWLKRQTAAGTMLICPAITLAEVACAISRRLDQASYGKQCVEALYRIPKFQLIPVDSALAEMSYQVGADLRLRGADAVYVALAHRLGIPLVSWDKEQIDRVSRIIESYQPPLTN